ncbi:MAG: IS21-like element helper ATPase IstB [Anaerolineae bacterium]
MSDVISKDLKTMLRNLRLSRMLDTLPERLTMARQSKIPHQDFLLTVLSDEVSRRQSNAVRLRAERGHLDPTMQLETWDETANVSYDRELLSELATLRFVEARNNVTIVGEVGVGKTFIAHALGHIACRRGISVLAIRADRMLKTLMHARLDNSYEAEMRKLITPDVLIIDDFALDQLDSDESRDTFEIFVQRHRAGTTVITSNRGPDEWHALFADPLRAQAAIDRFTSRSYDLVIEGESYRHRQKPRMPSPDHGAPQNDAHKRP